MGLHEEIDTAVGAHGLWKSRLRHAVATRRTDVPPEVVRADDRCKFGQWLHHAVGPAERTGSSFRTVRDLHAQFHREAAKVLDLALAGRTAEAEAAMAPASAFTEVSTQLTAAMMAWKRTSP